MVGVRTFLFFGRAISRADSGGIAEEGEDGVAAGDSSEVGEGIWMERSIYQW